MSIMFNQICIYIVVYLYYNADMSVYGGGVKDK